jgi:hypothetical protein
MWDLAGANAYAWRNVLDWLGTWWTERGAMDVGTGAGLNEAR